MAAARSTDDRLVYRPGLSRLLLAALAAIGAWWVVDAVLRGRPGDAVVIALCLVAVVTGLGCLLWRPAVVVDDEGVELRNVLRDVRVPWPALTEIGTRYTLTLYVGERRFQSWAGAAPGRPTATRRLLGGVLPDGAGAGPGRHDHAVPDPRWTAGGGSEAPASSRDLGADSGATAFMIEQRWQAWRDSASARRSGPGTSGPGTVVVRWRPALPAVAAVTTVAAVIAVRLHG